MWLPSLVYEITDVEKIFYKWIENVCLMDVCEEQELVDDELESINGLKVEELSEETYEEWIGHEIAQEWLK
jgi:hypothetical protein